MRYLPYILFTLVALTVSSCSTTTPQEVREKAVKEAVETPGAWATKTLASSNTPLPWLESFGDPLMLKLIEEGRANNNDLQIAAGNMDKAWLLARKSGAALSPTVDLSLGGSESGRLEGSSSNSNFTIGLQASWELDVWGRIRSGVSAAEAQAQAAEADYLFAQHSLSANIAKTYFKVIEARKQQEIGQNNVAILENIMRITQFKYDNGLSSAQDVAINRANLASARDQLLSTQGSYRDGVRALEVLLGRYPNANLDISATLPSLPPSPPAGIPSEMLERRPDIVSAERQIASAFDATDQAKAAQLPKFSLTSSLSGSSGSLSNILNPANIAWQLAGNLVAPLIDGGRRKIDVEIATIEQKQAISNYAQKALLAFSEVENNLDQGVVLGNREKELDEVLTQSKKAYGIAELRYKEGESDLLDTLQIQQQLIAAESNLLSIQRLQLEQRVNLHLSLGGDW